MGDLMTHSIHASKCGNSRGVPLYYCSVCTFETYSPLYFTRVCMCSTILSSSIPVLSFLFTTCLSSNILYPALSMRWKTLHHLGSSALTNLSFNPIIHWIMIVINLIITRVRKLCTVHIPYVLPAVGRLNFSYRQGFYFRDCVKARIVRQASFTCSVRYN